MILAFGKLTDVMTGPCGTMLNQAGYNKLALYDNLAALVLNVGLNFALIPTYGLRGSGGLDGVAGPRQRRRAYQVRRYITPAWPFSEGTPKALAAFAWSVLAALVVRELVDGSPRKELYIATPVVFGVYAIFLVSLGLTAEDRLVLRDLLSVLRRGGRRAPSAGRRSGTEPALATEALAAVDDGPPPAPIVERRARRPGWPAASAAVATSTSGRGPSTCCSTSW